ncbi:hypothetical protein CRG98_039124 [Punica granatum]|uniref:Reverse transcriptase zinc-binding domain-containing protein n=1 Tax=Punica granatum TaxID=22663 RepID=A0A2I0I922_PUNGR|nr:hypothetical protein CRG98_039124 [Punica granatum]
MEPLRAARWPKPFSRRWRRRWRWRGRWRRRRRALLPHEATLHIAATAIPSPERGPDRAIWRLASSRVFSVKSAYEFLTRTQVEAEDVLWRLIWKWRGPHRIIKKLPLAGGTW